MRIELLGPGLDFRPIAAGTLAPRWRVHGFDAADPDTFERWASDGGGSTMAEWLDEEVLVLRGFEFLLRPPDSGDNVARQ